MGAIYAEGTEQESATLGTYGFNLGIAFQIRDDTLDLAGEAGDLGKPVAADLRQGKMSLATLFALRSPARAKFLSVKNTAEAIRLLKEINALEYAMQKAEGYADRAKAALSTLPESEAKAALCEKADFAVSRNW
jgi:octaprenyl-diphosphate synthase